MKQSRALQLWYWTLKNQYLWKISYSTLIINNAYFVRMRRTWVAVILENSRPRWWSWSLFMCCTRAVKVHRHYVCFVRQRQTWNSHNVMMIMIYGKSFVTNSISLRANDVSCVCANEFQLLCSLWPWTSKCQSVQATTSHTHEEIHSDSCATSSKLGTIFWHFKLSNWY